MGQKNNLLSRLCSYSFNKQKLSRENFLTEVVAYLFENDRTFRKIFLKTILIDGRKRRKFYYGARAETQVFYPRCIVDLVLKPEKGEPILIEVKIKASETQTKIQGFGQVPQIRKYIKLGRGPVVYLASIQAPSADVLKPKRFLGRFHIEKLQQELQKAKHLLTPIGLEFIRFLEEEGMSYPEPFTVKELKLSKAAFDFAAKAENHLNEAVAEHQTKFKLALKTNRGFSRPSFNSGEKSAYVYLRYFRKWPFKSAGFSIDPYDNATYFSVWLKLRKEADSDKRGRKAGFDIEPPYWVERVKLKGGSSDEKRIRKCVEKAISNLKKVL